MDKENVYGSRISVNFSSQGFEGREYSPSRTCRSRRGTCSNPESGSSREPSPVPQSSDSSSSQQSSSNVPPDLLKRAISGSGTFLTVADVEEDLLTKKLETITVAKSHNTRNRENSPLMSSVTQHGVFESKRTNKTPQKNVGRVSPFMKSEAAIKREHPVQTNRTFVIEPSLTNTSNQFNGGSSRSNNNSPIRSYSLSALTCDYPGDPQHDFVTVRDTMFAVPAVPVELLVTNLDLTVEINEMKKILLAGFREHVMVLHISMLLQPDGSVKCVVKVPSIQDAQLAISQLHRRKIGSKRILISYVSSDRVVPLHILKAEVLALFADIPARHMPLFKFRELFENRYHRSVGIPDLYKIKDAIVITEDPMGRMVSINPEYRRTPSPVEVETSMMLTEPMEKSYCELHFQMPESRGWAVLESVYPLPDVYISLKLLSQHIHTLLDSHHGCLLLNSVCDCYQAEFGLLPIVEIERSDVAGPLNRQTLNYPCSVPLEHLIACIPGIQISHSSLGIKKIQWLENRTLEEESSRSISPALVGQLLLFGKEVVDLIKSQPHCTVQFNKFIPTYHHHFGRQCRVADYGFTKLVDLLEAIPHNIQILGQGQNRSLTLTHRCQVKRFGSDLTRVLKSRAGKQVLLSEFPKAFELCTGRPLDIAHYGVCHVSDMLTEVSDNVVVTTNESGEMLVAIPKREQTAEEIELTKEFAKEALELLRHTPNCSMTFSKFIPNYHHHFGRQCRVSDYGFTKLIEVFEAIPSMLEVHGSGENKILKLTLEEKLKVLTEKIQFVVRSCPQEQIRLDLLPQEYTKIHGHTLDLEEFGCDHLYLLLMKLKGSFKLKQTFTGPMISIVDCSQTKQLSQQIRQLLMEIPQGKMKLERLGTLYHQRFGMPLDMDSLENMKEDIEIKNGFVHLSSRQLLARDILVLLNENGGQLALQNFEGAFVKRFNTPCRPARFGCTTMAALFKSFPDYLLVRGRRGKKAVLLNRDSVGFLLPSVSIYGKNQDDPTNKNCSSDGETELMLIPSSVDLMSEPIPSRVPSPEILPEVQPLREFDLMRFESPMPSQTELICDGNNQEQWLLRGQPLCFTASTTSSLHTTGVEPFCPYWSDSLFRDQSCILSVNGFSMDTDEMVRDFFADVGSPSRSSLRTRSRIAAHFSQLPN